MLRFKPEENGFLGESPWQHRADEYGFNVLVGFHESWGPPGVLTNDNVCFQASLDLFFVVASNGPGI